MPVEVESDKTENSDGGSAKDVAAADGTSAALANEATSGHSASPPGPPRVFERRFSSTGLVVGAFFFALSLLPSLLPRAGYVQGIASGVTFAVGYGIGATCQAVYDYLEVPKLRGRARRIVFGILNVLVLWAVAGGLWRQVGWQNEIRETFGMPPVSFSVWPVIIGVAVLTAAVLLVVSRAIRLLFRTVGRWLGSWMPRRLAITLGTAALLLLGWGLISGVLVTGFFAVANTIFSGRDGATSEGIVQTQSTLRSGGPGSLVQWDQLGRQGRSFVATGPTVAQIEEATGSTDALEPIRVYVGLKSAPTLQERADLLLEELKRTGAFERELVVVATTTGTGFLDPNGVDPVEYVWDGDTAIAGVQYSYLPSWISLLADQEAVQETSRTVFRTVHAYWSSLPKESRPQLYLYGLSLGSYGVESILGSVEVVNEPVNGAFMTGPPFVNMLHEELTREREPGTSPGTPTYQDGSTVRFTADESNLDATPGPWGPTRLLYLQHGSDPVVFFSPDLAWSVPDWLLEGQRAPDVSPRMGWFPLVTMWQVALDLPGAGNVPEGFGHMYSKRANLDGWIAVTDPEGWTQARTDDIATALETTPTAND